jgi:tRNA1Val (adenine37-N6)-methyltransferase
MGKNSFQFKQFVVNQEHCAMKVGTDGTLLGAWANAPEGASRILDIGTGTGLIALMMAQRFPDAQIIGIDIDLDATIQARENVAASPFADRIMINREDATKFEDKEGFDAIVSNPPYFVDSLTCPGEQRTMARHAVTLNYQTLMHTANKLLKNDGIISIVIPTENIEDINSVSACEGLFVTRVCKIKTTPNKQPKRQLVEIRKHPVDKIDYREEILEDNPGHRSEWYHNLTKDFYIK